MAGFDSSNMLLFLSFIKLHIYHLASQFGQSLSLPHREKKDCEVAMHHSPITVAHGGWGENGNANNNKIIMIIFCHSFSMFANASVPNCICRNKNNLLVSFVLFVAIV
jgi:hypothetical protein